ncbi:MAG: hypothetical protein K2N54_04685 [Helicobacter sp.]|nr:hypothetical protein [Helicobacter sp.]
MSNGRIGHLHWRCDFSRTHKIIMSAVKTAPPMSLQGKAEAINRVGFFLGFIAR